MLELNRKRSSGTSILQLFSRCYVVSLDTTRPLSRKHSTARYTQPNNGQPLAHKVSTLQTINVDKIEGNLKEQES